MDPFNALVIVTILCPIGMFCAYMAGLHLGRAQGIKRAGEIMAKWHAQGRGEE